MTLKDITVNIFTALAGDDELLDLLEVPTTVVDGKTIRTLKDIREQLIEDKYPSDLVVSNLSRLCVYELPSSPTMNPIVEKGYFEFDIYCTKEKNKADRRTLMVAERLYNLLDNERRKAISLSPLLAGVGLKYRNRLANMQTDSREWVKYGIVFTYDIIRL